MFVSIYYKPSLFNAHTMILIVHIFMNVNKLCLNQGQDNIEWNSATGADQTHASHPKPFWPSAIPRALQGDRVYWGKTASLSQ